jgi:hypothetical protein
MSLLLAAGAGGSTVQASGGAISRSLAVGALTGIIALSGVSIPRTTTAGQLTGAGALSGPSIARTITTGAVAGSGAVSGTSIVRTTTGGAMAGAAALAGTSIARTTNGGDLLASSPGSISGIGISGSRSLGDLNDATNFGCWGAGGTTPTADSVHFTADSACTPKSNPGGGGGGGWHQGENARFNLQHSPKFEFSKKPVVAAQLGKDAVHIVQEQIVDVPNRIDDDELAMVLLLGGTLSYPSKPGVDDDDEAIWILLS